MRAFARCAPSMFAKLGWLLVALPVNGQIGFPAYRSPTADEYLAKRPEVVVGPWVSDVWWSPDGRYLCIYREEPEFELGERAPSAVTELTAWDRKTRKSRVAWRAESGPGYGSLEFWFWCGAPSRDRLYLGVRGAAVKVDKEVSVYRIDLPTGKQKLVLGVPVNSRSDTSPVAPVTVFTGSTPEGTWAQTLDDNGATGAKTVISSESLGLNGWSPDGLTAYFVKLPWPAGPDARAKLQWTSFDSRTGVAKRLSSAPAMYSPPVRKSTTPPCDVTLDEPTVHLISPQFPPRTLRLISGGSRSPVRVVLSGSAESATLAPDFGAVAFTSEGYAWVSTLKRLPHGTAETLQPDQIYGLELAPQAEAFTR